MVQQQRPAVPLLFNTLFTEWAESHCIQATSWELSVMFPADKSYLLCRGESMVHLLQLHQNYTAHGGGGGGVKRKEDQTKDKLCSSAWK